MILNFDPALVIYGLVGLLVILAAAFIGEIIEGITG
jgi:hypothetical protein